MISFVRGPGGWLRRTTSEFVPGCLAVAAGGLALPFVGVVPTLGIGAVVWVVSSAVLRAVRRRPRARRLYRMAVLAHVVFWTVLGVLATVLDGPGPSEMQGSHAWAQRTTFLAGYGAADYAIPDHVTIAGWGSRPRRLRFPPFAGLGVLGRLGLGWMGSDGEARPPRVPLFRGPAPGLASESLGARALVLRSEAAGAAPFAFVRLDLVTCDADLANVIRQGVADLGFLPETVVVAATHTHSGPGGYSSQPFSAVVGTDHFDPTSFRAIRAAGIAAVRAAFQAARPARIALLRSHDRGAEGATLLARSRRSDAPDGIDDRVYGLRVEGRTDDRPIAVLLNYAVHPTLLRRRHLAYHRDMAGALEDALSERLAGHPPVLFFNGAVAYATPHGVPGTGQQRGAILAARFCDRVAPDFAAGRGQERLRMAAAQVRQQMAGPRLVVASSDRAGFLDDHGGTLWSGDAATLAAKAITLPANMLIWSFGLPELRVGFRWNGSVGAVVNLESFVERRAFDVGAVAFETGAGERWALLWAPGEATSTLGRAWREAAARRGFEHSLIVGFGGGSSAYLTTPEEYRAGTYEARGTVFGEQAGLLLSGALEQALDVVGAPTAK